MNESNNASQADGLKHLLRRRLADPHALIARHASRKRFSPSMAYGRHFVPPFPSAKPAAVMILLKPSISGDWCIPLTERPTHLPDHPGQISLPGGRLESNESLMEAAVREFNEEIGTNRFPGEVVGQLQPVYVFNSDYYVTPFVAVAESTFEYAPCHREVARVIEMPTHLLLMQEYHIKRHQRGSAVWSALEISYERASIWGATAIVLGEFAAILRGS